MKPRNGGVKKQPAAAAMPPLGVVNLLSLIDPSRDTVSGKWSIGTDGALMCLAGKGVKSLQIPYIPPEEYDIRAVVTRRGGSGDHFGMGLVGGSRQFVAAVDVGHGTRGLDTIDGNGVIKNETASQGTVLGNDARRTILYGIRKTRVTVAVDGKAIVDWKADYRRVGLNPIYAVPDTKALFLNSWYSSFQISQLSLVAISGQGRRLR